MTEQQQTAIPDTTATAQARELYPAGSQIVLPAEQNTRGVDVIYRVREHRDDFVVIVNEDEPTQGAHYVTTIDAVSFYRPVQTVEQAASAALALLDELVGADILDLEEEQDYEVGLTRTIETLRAALKRADLSATVKTVATRGMPEYLRSSCSCSVNHGTGIRYDAACSQAVKQNPATGRYFITSGHVGFNLPANNRTGYATNPIARAAIVRIITKAGGRS